MIMKLVKDAIAQETLSVPGLGLVGTTLLQIRCSKGSALSQAR